MVDFIGKGLDMLRRLFRGTSAAPREVRAAFPRSWFTKKGPGVTKEARAAFWSLTDDQRVEAVARGWAPAHWLNGRKF